MTRHAGNLAVTPERSVPLYCEECDVAWNGCAAAAACPECGNEQEWWYRTELDAACDALSEPHP